MDWLLLVLWVESAVLGDLSLSESLKTLSSFKDDVLSLDLPQSVSLRLDSDDQEVDGDVASLGYLLVFLHQTHDEIGLL